jgi:hypothetical protein
MATGTTSKVKPAAISNSFLLGEPDARITGIGILIGITAQFITLGINQVRLFTLKRG